MPVKELWEDSGEIDRDSQGLFTSSVTTNAVENVLGYENTVAVVYGRTREELAKRLAQIATAPKLLALLMEIEQKLNLGTLADRVEAAIVEAGEPEHEARRFQGAGLRDNNGRSVEEE